MIYDVYAGGIHAVEATLDVDVTDTKYDITMGAYTRGFLGKLAPWNGTFESNGWIVGKNDYRPKLHKSVATWRNETEVKEYTYGQDRSFKGLTITDHGKEPKRKETNNELTQGTTDVLTATLLAMNAIAQGHDCKGTSEVFDGKRRFKLIFHHEETEELEKNYYNIYEGPSVKCTVEVEPVAGEWHKKPRGWMSIQEQGRERGTMPTVWFAKVKDGEAAIPIKVLVKTAYGALYMHLTEYHSGNTTMIAERRKKDAIE